jgi:predicted  nucleic acid-binding Zn-ribbon protein
VKIEATAKQIRSLLQLAEFNEGADRLTPEAYRRGQEALQRGLPRQLLERYQWLIDTGRKPAVVAIEHGVCSGCHIRLHTMLDQQAGRAVAVYTCPHCRRMMYAAEFVPANSRAGVEKPRHPAPPSAARRP